jgi:S1-C subfamily serine protease
MEVIMADLRSFSESLAALAAGASAKLFHVPSPLGGRSALGFDGSLLLVPALDASEGETLEILGPGGRSMKAKAVGFDRGLRLAVLELAESLPATAWTAASALPALGSLVLVAAYPSPQGAEVRLDAVRFAGGEGDEAYIQTDGSRFPGFSGAALVDPDGKLTGFLVSDLQGNRGWAIPGARAAELARSIAERGFPGRAWLGISTLPVEAPQGYAERFGDGRESALIVASLEDEGPAAKAGILVGDLLVSIGGSPTPDPASLRAALDAAHPGEALRIVLLRAGERMELDAKPAARKDDEEGDRRGYGRGDWWGCGCGHGRGHGWGWGWRPGR